MERRQSGMTLVEVMYAMMILAMLLMTLVATMIQSRRLTEGSLRQTVASSVAQSYMDQLKNMSISGLVDESLSYPYTPFYTGASYELTIISNDTASDTDLWTSTGSPPSLSSITLGTTPSGGAVDNLEDFNLNGSYGGATQVNQIQTSTTTVGQGVLESWKTAWPGAANPSSTTGTSSTGPWSNDLLMNVWVWITDVSPAKASGGSTSGVVYSITLIYTWQVPNGGNANAKYFSAELQSMRCAAVSTDY